VPKLTPEQRKEQAQKAAAARWKNTPKAERKDHGSWLNSITPEALSERNRANVTSRWEKSRKAEREGGSSSAAA
jgi:hypothetical protein